MGVDSVIMGVQVSNAVPNAAKVKPDNSVSSQNTDESASDSSFSSILRQKTEAKAATSPTTKTSQVEKSSVDVVSEATVETSTVDQAGNALQLNGDFLPLQSTGLIGFGSTDADQLLSGVDSADSSVLSFQEDLNPTPLISPQQFLETSVSTTNEENLTAAISFSMQTSPAQRGFVVSATKVATAATSGVLGETALAETFQSGVKSQLTATPTIIVDDQPVDVLASSAVAASGAASANNMLMTKAMLMNDRLAMSADGKITTDMMALTPLSSNQLAAASPDSNAVAFSLAQLDKLTASQGVAPSTFQTAIATQVASPNWGDTVMQRVMWMSSQNIQSAEIHLDPPELGALMVKINTQHDQTSVAFSSPHAVVRDALDQSLPKLRDMMEQQGLDLGRVDVFGQSRQQASDNGGEQPSTTAQSFSGDELVNDVADDVIVQEQGLGLVNAYA